MRVLVTGASGLVGSAVMRVLRARDVDAVGVSFSDPAFSRVDLRMPGVAEKLVSGTNAVVHCAAKIGGVGWQKENPAGPITANLVMAVNIFEAAAKAKVHLVFLSSSTVYPTSCGGDFNAHESWTLVPEPEYRGVGGMKVYLERLLAHYEDVFPGFSYTILRPTAVYGPCDRGFFGGGHVVPDLLRRADAGEMPLLAWGSPDVVRDFVYADDVAEAVSKALIDESTRGIAFNVGSGDETTIGRLADEVMLAVHGPQRLVELEDRTSQPLVQFDGSKPAAMPRRQVSITYARDVLGWRPRTSLGEGLRKTLKWYRGLKR